jgi:hypothetical protein
MSPSRLLGFGNLVILLPTALIRKAVINDHGIPTTNGGGFTETLPKIERK